MTYDLKVIRFTYSHFHKGEVIITRIMHINQDPVLYFEHNIKQNNDNILKLLKVEDFENQIGILK